MTLGPILWKQKSTGTIFSFVGEERDEKGMPFALMKFNGVIVRVDPLEMVKKDGDWEKL